MPAPRTSDPKSRTKAPKADAKAAPAAAKGADSKGKKRVRVQEPEEEAKAVVEEVKEVKTKGKKSKKDAAPVVESTSKDLKNKTADEIVPIISADAPAPSKSSLKTPFKKEKAPDVVEEVVVEAEDEPEEEIDFLKGFESAEGEDSSDEEEGDDEQMFKLDELPSVSKEEAGVQKKLQAKAERKKNAKTGTIYLGRIPHGFHEEEMNSYFSQFGEVTRLRLSRNKATGASKHYAFIEFAYASVASIVQETMDNYLLSGHILVCKIVPDDEMHPKLWIGANRKFRPVPKARADRVRREAPKTDAQKETIKQKLLRREQAKREQLAALGIDYDFKGYANKALAIEEKAAVKPAKKEKAKKVPAVKAAKTDEPAKKKSRKST
ncbi:nucleolar protein 15, partial [Phenoliferia sp. Uapishka_3]